MMVAWFFATAQEVIRGDASVHRGAPRLSAWGSQQGDPEGYRDTDHGRREGVSAGRSE